MQPSSDNPQIAIPGRAEGQTDQQPADPETAAAQWWVYMIRCDDGSLYTGVSTDPERRFKEHLQHPQGAKYFNGRRPLAIVYTEPGHTRSSACQREAVIKKLKRADKLALIPEAARNKGS